MMQLESWKAVLGGVTHGTASQGPLWEPLLRVPEQAMAILHWVFHSCSLWRVNIWGSILLPLHSSHSCQDLVKSVNKSLKINEIWHFLGDHSTLALLWRATWSSFWTMVLPEQDTSNKWPDDGKGQGGTTKKSTESLAATLHFSELGCSTLESDTYLKVSVNLWALVQIHVPWKVWF